MCRLEDMSLAELWALFPIILTDHKPEYRVFYDEEAIELKRVLKGHKICRISHIGSTSVKNLIAKPIVDILLELEDGYDLDQVLDLLQSNGWILMKKKRRPVSTLAMNKGYTPDGFAEKVYHLHVRPFGDWDELYFRDYLRECDGAAQEYRRLKTSLKEDFEHDRDAYTEGKSEFVQRCTEKARRKFGARYLPDTGKGRGRAEL